MYIWIFTTRLIIQSSSWATEVPCKLNARLVLRILGGFHLFSLDTTGRPLKLRVQAWLIWIQAVETSSAHNGSPSWNALYAGGECGRERVHALPGYFTTRGELEGTMAWSCRERQTKCHEEEQQQQKWKHISLKVLLMFQYMQIWEKNARKSREVRSEFMLCAIAGLLMDFSHWEAHSNEEAGKERTSGGSVE